MNRKKMIVIVISVCLLVGIGMFYFFHKTDYKTLEFGNTNLKSVESMKEYILNLSSYQAKITMEVTSNKNTNKYELTQEYASPNIFKQVVSEPSNIQGLVTTYDGNNLSIENTKLNVTKLYENYPYLAENSISLASFIECYKQDGNAIEKQDGNYFIFETKSEKNSKNVVVKRLYIDKTTAKPSKLEIMDGNKNVLVYIVYNEIKINSTNKQEILAFKLKEESAGI